MPYAALLRGRVSLAGHYYLNTMVTHRRVPLFADFACGRRVMRSMHSSDLAGRSETLACVVMPDHVHWLLKLKTLPLSQVIGLFKGGVAHELNRERSVSETVWQRGYHDHALRWDESLEEAARYVIENPLRAELVRHIGDYPLWHSVWDVQRHG